MVKNTNNICHFNHFSRRTMQYVCNIVQPVDGPLVCAGFFGPLSTGCLIALLSSNSHLHTED